jgi:hypothetical protein
MSEKLKPRQWLVLGGCPRSGTTLLNAVMNSSESVKLSNEQDLFKTFDLIDRVFYRERHVLNRAPRQLSDDEKKVGAYNGVVLAATIKKECIGACLEGLYLESLVRPGCDLPEYLGDKFPKYYRWDISELEKYLGPLKIIHVTRSPIEVIHSCLSRSHRSKIGQDWWPIEPLESYINEWIDAWNFACSHSGNENFYHVKYEDFILRPSECAQQLANFLSVKNDFKFENIYQPSKKSGLSKNEYRMVSKYIPDELLRWEADLDVYQRKFPNLADTPNINALKALYFKMIRYRKRKMAEGISHES